VRRLAVIYLGVVLLLVVLLAGAIVAIPFVELAPYIAPRVQAVLGRNVTIGSFRLHPGWSFRVAIDDLHVANMSGGRQPDMVTLRHMTASLAPLSLLGAQPELRHLTVDGLVVFLEQNKDLGSNWVLHKRDPAKPRLPDQDPTGRAAMPTLLDAKVQDSTIIFVLAGGTALTTHLDQASIASAGDTTPVTLTATGNYNAIPLQLLLTGGSWQVLHQPTQPFPVQVEAHSNTTVLHFKGTAMDPLNVDGLDGALDADIPNLNDIMARFGAPVRTDTQATLHGRLTRRGDDWALHDLSGSVETLAFTGDETFTEGKRGQPDQVTASLSVDTVDVGHFESMIGFRNEKAPAARNAMPPVPDQPDAIGSAELHAHEIRYHGLVFTDVAAHATLQPSRATLDSASLSFAGARTTASAVLENAGGATHLAADAALAGAELSTLARALDIGILPVNGTADARLSVDMTGVTIPEALQRSHITTAVTMANGTVPRIAIRLVSANLAALFGHNRGDAAVRCLLAVADLRGLAGSLAPARLATADGTISGYGRINLASGALDMTLRSERATTGFFSLDVPIHVGGTMSDPHILPTLSAQRRARLRATDDVAGLPDNVLSLVRGSACLRR
jgi:AsmA family protein